MLKSRDRFECRPDRAGTLLVWDKIAGMVASLGGCRLAGRDPQRARVACGILAKIYHNRLDRESIRL